MALKRGKSEVQARVRWARLIKQWRRSGLTMLAWCREQEVSYTQFCKWRRRLEAKEAAALTLIPVVPSTTRSALVVRLPGAVGIEVESGFDPALLAAVVRALSEVAASC